MLYFYKNHILLYGATLVINLEYSIKIRVKLLLAMNHHLKLLLFLLVKLKI
jgi:hypothetical protein